MPDAWRMMWVMVMYDLPVGLPAERKAATKFHRLLVTEGFSRLHYSVYTRYCGSAERALTFERRVQQSMPKRGYVCLLKLTDRQMVNMRRWIKGGYRPLEDAAFEPPAQFLLL